MRSRLTQFCFRGHWIFHFMKANFGLASTCQTRPPPRHTAHLFSLRAAVPRALNTMTEPSSACPKSGGGGGGAGKQVRGAADGHQPNSAHSSCHDTQNLHACPLCLRAGRVSNTVLHFRPNSNGEAWRKNGEAHASAARTLSLRMPSRKDGCARITMRTYTCTFTYACTFTFTRYLCMYIDIYIYVYIEIDIYIYICLRIYIYYCMSKRERHHSVAKLPPIFEA